MPVTTRLVVVIAALAVLAGCTPFMHGYTLSRYEGQLLSASGGPGAERLRMEAAYDATIDTYTRDRGTPDYIYVEGSDRVYLVYLDEDRVASFDRGFTPQSSLSILPRVPDELLPFLPRDDRERLLAARAERGDLAEPAPDGEGDGQRQEVEAADAAEPSVSVGSCFAAGPDGKIVTAYHVVSDAEKMVVKFSEEKGYEARLDRVSAGTDLAVLRIERRTPIYLAPGSPGAVAVGDRVFTVGYPAIQLLGLDPKYSDGAVAALSGPAGDATYLQVSVPVQPGSSGGPLVSERGELVGVAVGTADALPFFAHTGALPQNVNWGIRAEYLVPLLDGSEPLPPVSDRREAVERAKHATCRIEAQLRAS